MKLKKAKHRKIARKAVCICGSHMYWKNGWVCARKEMEEINERFEV